MALVITGSQEATSPCQRRDKKAALSSVERSPSENINLHKGGIDYRSSAEVNPLWEFSLKFLDNCLAPLTVHPWITTKVLLV